MRNLLALLALTALFSIPVLAQPGKVKMSVNANGLEYKIFKSNKGPKIASGDLVYFKFKGFVSDSMLYNSYRNTQMPYMSFALQEKLPKANFEEGLSLMTSGDSALFLVNTDSFFSAYAGGHAPAFVKPGDKIHFYVKIDSVVTKKELAARKERQEQEMRAIVEKEQAEINNYIKSSGLSFKQTSTGLYYLVTHETTGAKAAPGDKVAAIYTGRLLNGKVFDSNKSNGVPFEFTLGEHQVIAGWDEIFGMLKEGETATILLPSKLAYGAQGAGNDIKPYAPLLFDVEFVKVTPAPKEDASAVAAPTSQGEKALIDKYLSTQDLIFIPTPSMSGLYYAKTRTTQGALAKPGDQISAYYTGKLLNGKVFDSNASSGRPFEFTLGAHQVIAGWDEIFSILHVGEKAIIVMPSSLAYGSRGAGNVIPPNAPLIFEVEFVNATSR